jgi:hypothetical protein
MSLSKSLVLVEYMGRVTAKSVNKAIDKSVTTVCRSVAESILVQRFGVLNTELSAVVSNIIKLPPSEFTVLLINMSRQELIDQFASTKSKVRVNGNEVKAEATKNKLKIVVEMVKKLYGTFETAKDAIIHIRKVAEEEFEDMGTKFGGPTLNKPEYREIWKELLKSDYTPLRKAQKSAQNH